MDEKLIGEPDVDKSTVQIYNERTEPASRKSVVILSLFITILALALSAASFYLNTRISKLEAGLNNRTINSATYIERSPYGHVVMASAEVRYSEGLVTSVHTGLYLHITDEPGAVSEEKAKTLLERKLQDLLKACPYNETVPGNLLYQNDRVDLDVYARSGYEISDTCERYVLKLAGYEPRTESP